MKERVVSRTVLIDDVRFFLHITLIGNHQTIAFPFVLSVISDFPNSRILEHIEVRNITETSDGHYVVLSLVVHVVIAVDDIHRQYTGKSLEHFNGKIVRCDVYGLSVVEYVTEAQQYRTFIHFFFNQRNQELLKIFFGVFQPILTCS